MALIFPGSPISGQQTTIDGVLWQYDGYRWVIIPPSTGYQGSGGFQGSIGFAGSAGYTIPVTNQTGTYVPTQSDNGNLIRANANVTLNTAVFANGQNFSVWNTASANIVIIANSGVTIYKNLGYTTTGTGNCNVISFGLATILCVNTDTFTVAGPGVF